MRYLTIEYNVFCSSQDFGRSCQCVWYANVSSQESPKDTNFSGWTMSNMNFPRLYSSDISRIYIEQRECE